MGFQVKYEEITSIRELILAQLDRWIEQIDAVRNSIVEIAAMSEMHGEAAEHVRSYMWDYHMNLANMIKDTIETYRSSFILYTDWYYNIDSDQMAEMSQDSMEGLEENIQGARSDFDAVAEEVADIERELSAYLDVGRFSTTCMESCFDNALAGVQNVRTQIGEYEEAHSHADMYPIDMMAGYLRSIIGGQLGGSSATISAYDASVVNATESFQLAQMMDGMLSTYLEQVKDRVNSCEEFYELQQQQWQESIRLRTEEGIVKTLVGVGTMILGGMLVVATCGMALPLVTTVGVVAIGLGTTAYGCANAIEGSQDVYAGVIGDPRMVSVNPIRDTLFASNPELYYLIGNALTISASMILTGGMAANAAVSAGTSIGRAVVTEYAKQGLTVAASSYVEKSMTEATNSPLAGFVVGSLTGMATYGTLSEAELEVVNNLKRPQQLGNVGESGSTTVIYGSDDIANYQYNMIENPGPLAEIQGNPAKNFYGGRYNVEVLTEDRIYYRGGNSDKALGQWFTTEPPESVAKVRIDTAVKPQWIDTITGELTGESVVDTVYAIKIPKGTTVYTGPVGSQGGAYCGGYNIMQTFIKEPWKLDYQVISKSSLK